MKKETSKRLSAGLLASAVLLNAVVTVSANDNHNYHSAGESGIQGTFTSAPLISFNTLGESDTAPLKIGNYTNWVDRVDFPPYALDFYTKLSDTVFWTTADNFAENGANVIDVSYGNNTSDKFNGLLIYSEENMTAEPTSEQKNEIYAYCRAAYDAFDRDNPAVFWLTGETNFKHLVTYETVGETTTYTLNTYLVLKDYNDNKDMRREAYRDTAVLAKAISDMNEKVDEILEGASGTDYQKIKYFNEYLTLNNEYNTAVSAMAGAPEGAAEALCALNGSTGENGPVCEGYSRALKVLCDEAGIPCILTDGTAGGEAHMWNCAYIDGKWYSVDVTWNDPVGGESGAVSGYENEDYLLVGTDTVIDEESFGDSHSVSNKASLMGPSFTNGPVLSTEAYTLSEAEKTYEASVGGINYETIEEAFSFASEGEAVTLLENITRESNVTVEESGTLDLNGKTIDLGEYTMTFESAVTVTDAKGEGAINGSVSFADGGKAEGVKLGNVYISGGSFTFTDSTADTLSVTGGTVSVSESKLGGVSSNTIILDLLASGQMYYTDGAVVTADKLYSTSLSGDITVSEGKAKGVIRNNDYTVNYTYTGEAITAPTADNFTYYGAAPSFSWSGGELPSAVGTYTLTVTSGETSFVSGAVEYFTVVIDEYQSSAAATLSGEKGNNGWYISPVQLSAPAGYQISRDKNGLYADYISFTTDTRETVTYYLKESATGYIVPAQTIEVKVDVNPPVFSGNAVVSNITASDALVKVTAVDGDNGSGILSYLGEIEATGLSGSSTNGEFNLNNFSPATEYVLKVTVMDAAGHSAVGDVKFTTEAGEPNTIEAPLLTGVYGTAVRDMTISGGSVKYGTTVVNGTWSVTDENAADIPEVNGGKTYTLTFTPSSPAYKPVTTAVTPEVTPLPLTDIMITGVNEGYTYTGDIIKPAVVVMRNGMMLIPDVDYTVSYGANTNCGTDSGTVTINGAGNYSGTSTVTFDILKIDSVITTLTSQVAKNYGDDSFKLDINTNNPETPFTYTVANNDVVTVSDKGVVTIVGAGVAHVSVSQGETTNYKPNIVGVSVTITVAQAEAPEIDDITEKFVYTASSKGEINIADYMPSDSGKMAFSVSENSSLIANARISDDGTLTFDVGKGDIGDKGTIIVTVSSQNYESTRINIIAELSDKFPVKAKGKVTAGNNITYGQPLSDITFKDSTFVTDDGKEVEGTLEWETPDSVPAVSDKSAAWVFTPENTDLYESATGTAAITVKKAVPTVTAPAVEPMVYDSDRKLAQVVINGTDGKVVVNGTETAVKGAWSWSKPTTVPDCKTVQHDAVFTPDDTANYESVTAKVTFTVTKAQAEIEKNPTAAAITYGKKVSESTLKGGSANTAGKFTWEDGDDILTIGAYDRKVIFTPNDTTNYTGAETTVSLTVNKAKNAPNMPSSKINASYDITTVGGVELPDYWNWDAADAYKGLAVGSSATATAIYNGLDKGNYENESVVVTVTRSKCSHKNTKVLDKKDATCTEKGYTGDTYCSDCDTITVAGKEIAITDHSGGKATCSELAVCKTCKKTYGELDKKNHSGTKVIRNAIAPTTVSAGYSGDVCCSDCGTVLEKGEVLPILSTSTTANTNYPVWNDITTTTTKATTTTTKKTTTKKTTTKKNDSTTIVTTPSDSSTTTPPDYDEEAPYIYDDDEKYGWDAIIDEIGDAKSGAEVEVDMNYTTNLPAKALKALKGKNVDLVLHMDDYFSWVINGNDIETSKDINMEVYEGDENISVDVIDQVTGEAYSTTLTLTHNGEFGFTAVLRYEVGEPGYYANLYYYNPTKETATFVTSDKIDEDGFAELEFDHASEYIIVIDEKDHSSRAGIEYAGNGDDDDDYEAPDVSLEGDDDDDEIFDNGDDYYTGGDKNPSTGLSFGHILVGILGVSAFVVRPKNDKRQRKRL